MNLNTDDRITGVSKIVKVEEEEETLAAEAVKAEAEAKTAATSS